MPNPRWQPQFNPQGQSMRLLQASSANPYESVLNEVAQFGERVAVDAAASNAQDEVFGGQNPGLLPALTPAAMAYNRAAEGAYAARTESDLRTKSAEIAANFPGRTPQDVASASQLFDAYAGEIANQVPESMRGNVAREIAERRGVLIGGITSNAGRAEYGRNLDTLKMGLKADAEEAAAMARDGADPELIGALNARMQEKAGRMVEMGEWSPEVADLSVRELNDDIKSEAIFGQSIRGGDLLGTLDEVERGGALVEGMDLKSRDRLAARLQSELSHQRDEQRHRIYIGEAAARANGNNAKALAKNIAAGVRLTPEQESTAKLYLNGKVPMDSDAYSDLRESYTVRLVTQPAVSGTVADAQAALLAVDGYQPKDGTEVAIRDKSRKEIAGFIADLTGDDPIGKLSARGSTFPRGLPPIDLASPDAFAQSLVERRAAVTPAELQHGVPLPILSKSEAQQFGVKMAEWSVDQQAQALAAVEQQGPEVAARTLEGLGKAAPTLAHAGYLRTQGAPDTAGAVLRGSKVIAAGLVKAPTDYEKTDALAASGITQVLPPETAKQTLAAAEALRADFIARGEADPGLSESIRAVGGATGDYNNGKVLLPFGVADEGEFGDLVESVSDDEIIAMGGSPEYAQAIRDGKAKLRSVGAGRYLVRVGANVLPFELDFAAITPKAATPGIFGTGVRAVGNVADVGMENFKEAMMSGALDPSGR